jgi:hypothetical protein
MSGTSGEQRRRGRGLLEVAQLAEMMQNITWRRGAGGRDVNWRTWQRVLGHGSRQRRCEGRWKAHAAVSVTPPCSFAQAPPQRRRGTGRRGAGLRLPIGLLQSAVPRGDWARRRRSTRHRAHARRRGSASSRGAVVNELRRCERQARNGVRTRGPRGHGMQLGTASPEAERHRGARGERGMQAGEQTSGKGGRAI